MGDNIVAVVGILGVFVAVPGAICFVSWLIIKEIVKGRNQRHLERMATLQQRTLVAEQTAGEEEQMEEDLTVSGESEPPLSAAEVLDRRLIKGGTVAAVGAALTLYAIIIGSTHWLIIGLIPLRGIR